MLGLLHVSSPEESRVRARRRGAVALDDGLAAAHMVLAQQLAIYEWDWDGAMAALGRALELGPNSADAHYSLSKCLATVGRFEEALPHISRAQPLDPLSLIMIASLGWGLAVLERHEEADAAFRSALELDPRFVWTYVLQTWSFENRGLMEEAARPLRQASELSADNTVVQANLHTCSARQGNARRHVRSWMHFSRARERNTCHLSIWPAHTKDWASATRLWRQCRRLATSARRCWYSRAAQIFDPSRGNPRFQETCGG
jgi:tetratricopeptide (TPR) repeat protein